MSAQNSNTRDHSVMILLPDKQQQHLIIKFKVTHQSDVLFF